MKTIVIIAAILSAAIGTQASAGPDRLSLLVGSKHVGAEREFNEQNPGLFATWENRGAFDLSLGVYENSFSNVSIAATAALPVYEKGEFQASVFGGLALYPGDGDEFLVHAGDVVPLGGLQVRYRNVFVQAMPAGDMTVVAAGLTIPLH